MSDATEQITTIALDLDNTLLNSKKNISATNTAVLKQLHQQGKRIVLCTGRALTLIKPWLQQLDLTQPTDYSITYNGGLIQNNVTNEILSQTVLTKTDIAILYRDARKLDFPLDVLGIDGVYSLMELGKSDYENYLKHQLPFKNLTFEQLPEHEVYGKAVCATTKAVVQRIRYQLSPATQEKFQIVPSRREMLEFMPAGVNKAAGLKQLLAHFGDDFSNLMAFGDEENDLEMIQAAGIGVAMENAIPQVKAVAQAVTKNNDADGVAYYLRQYFQL